MSLGVEKTACHSLAQAGLPLDGAAEAACILASSAEAAEMEGDVWLRLGEELVAERFTGLVCVEYESGHSLGLAVVDGVVFGAHLADPGEGHAWGEAALDTAEGLWGPALVRRLPLSLGELENLTPRLQQPPA
ncbi:hypothetical protein CF15_07915 [Pyrodictium occultum]|uniref:Uncharacterized protein n=1 Tax=Pyrodictium occultum TaxID=2309 RepID=A0A0V8RRM2_PYROC|nr:hypothetical protein [Pyrodictium occultum]KSW10702.1 hypothetical protein CF15_07915 [Pyrodictium occultum]